MWSAKSHEESNVKDWEGRDVIQATFPGIRGEALRQPQKQPQFSNCLGQDLNWN
jgi:hypothetical protein